MAITKRKSLPAFPLVRSWTLAPLILILVALLCVWIFSTRREEVDELSESQIAVVNSLESTLISHNRSDPIRVALFDVEQGRFNAATPQLKLILDSMSNTTWREVRPVDIQSGALSSFDAVIFPGSSGSRQALVLGETGKQAIQSYVRSGGGYLGICGGAYLATADYDWSLGLVDAKTRTGNHTVPGVGACSWAERGEGLVRIEFPNAGNRVFGIKKSVDVEYSSGPIFSPCGRDDISDYVTLAVYRTETWEYDFQRGSMLGTPAIIAGQFGEGRVIACSPHPEFTSGLEFIVTRCLLAISKTSRNAQQSLSAPIN